MKEKRGGDKKVRKKNKISMPVWSVDNLACSITTSKDCYFEYWQMVFLKYYLRRQLIRILSLSSNYFDNYLEPCLLLHQLIKLEVGAEVKRIQR